MRFIISSLICSLTLSASLLALAAGCTAEPQGAAKPEITLEAAKPKTFVEAIQAHKGKVVVVDVWATFCIPCMEEFPNLVRLHEKYGKEGLVCISCSVDPAEDHAKALKFLKKVKATFPNYRFDFKENIEWQNHFDINGPPCIRVYGRDGNLAKHFVNDADNQFTYKDVEALVVKLLPAGK